MKKIKLKLTHNIDDFPFRLKNFLGVENLEFHSKTEEK